MQYLLCNLAEALIGSLKRLFFSPGGGVETCHCLENPTVVMERVDLRGCVCTLMFE